MIIMTRLMMTVVSMDDNRVDLEDGTVTDCLPGRNWKCPLSIDDNSGSDDDDDGSCDGDGGDDGSDADDGGGDDDDGDGDDDGTCQVGGGSAPRSTELLPSNGGPAKEWFKLRNPRFGIKMIITICSHHHHLHHHHRRHRHYHYHHHQKSCHYNHLWIEIATNHNRCT